MKTTFKIISLALLTTTATSAFAASEPADPCNNQVYLSLIHI